MIYCPVCLPSVSPLSVCLSLLSSQVCLQRWQRWVAHQCVLICEVTSTPRAAAFTLILLTLQVLLGRRQSFETGDCYQLIHTQTCAHTHTHLHTHLSFRVTCGKMNSTGVSARPHSVFISFSFSSSTDPGSPTWTPRPSVPQPTVTLFRLWKYINLMQWHYPHLALKSLRLTSSSTMISVLILRVFQPDDIPT